MKLHLTSAVTLIGAATMALALTACGGSDDADTAPTQAQETTTAASSTAVDADTYAASPEAEPPTAEQLNAILMTATDPAAPLDAKVKTVQGGDQAPELFETMTQLKNESGANFEVVPPVLTGYGPDSVLTVIKFTQPGQEPQTVKDVEFIYEDGTWKLSQSWACTLINNSGIAPESIPPMCHTDTAAADAQQPAEDTASAAN